MAFSYWASRCPEQKIKNMATDVGRRKFLTYSILSGLAATPFLVGYWRNSKNRGLLAQESLFATQRASMLSVPWIAARSPLMRSSLSPDGRMVAVSGGQFFDKQMIFSAEMDAVLAHSYGGVLGDETSLFLPIAEKLHPSRVLAVALSDGPEYRLACVIREAEDMDKSVEDFSDEEGYARYVLEKRCVDRLYVYQSNQKEPLFSLVCREDISGMLLFDGSDNYQVSWSGIDCLFFYNGRDIQFISLSDDINKTIYSSRGRQHIYSNIVYSESEDRISFIEIPRDDAKNEHVTVRLTSCRPDGSSVTHAGSLDIHNLFSTLLTNDNFHYFLPTLDGIDSCHYSVALDNLVGNEMAALQQLWNPSIIKNVTEVPFYLVPQAYLPSKDAVLCVLCLGTPNDDIAEIIRVAELHDGLVSTLALVYCS